MYTVEEYTEESNGRIMFQSFNVMFNGILVCESERESEAKNIASKLDSHDVMLSALEEARARLNITRINIATECHYHGNTRFDGVAECLQETIMEIDDALKLAKGE